MKKQELLKMMDKELMDKLYGFCYARTSDSYEAQELCSDVLYALVKAANKEGEIAEAYPFIWKVVRNVYADFCEKRCRSEEIVYQGDSEEIFLFLAAEEAEEDEAAEQLKNIYRQISFLTKAYRDVMILFYLDGLSTAEIAQKLNASETAIRQRLFSARKKVKSEVEDIMAEINRRPMALETMEYVLCGSGNPAWSDPRNISTRQFSRHIIWLCRKKPMSATEIAEQLNVPTVYVEEELEILEKGEYGRYGMLRKTDGGKYVLNFILWDKDEVEEAHKIYEEELPLICECITDYIEQNKEAYLAFPYLNKKVDLNLIIWQQVHRMSRILSILVEEKLKETYFAEVEKCQRPFTIYGYRYNGKEYGGSMNGTEAECICGYAKVEAVNISTNCLQSHFWSMANISMDKELLLAIRAIDGLNVHELTEIEREHAAKAIACGYLYREGDRLFTKILVHEKKDDERLCDVTNGICHTPLLERVEVVAQKMAKHIKKTVPEYLWSEWKYANSLANQPVLDTLVENLIAKGFITVPEGSIGAEGCWLCVEK